MLDNLNKAEERSGKLGELEDRADVLLAKVCRGRLAKRFKWKTLGSRCTILTKWKSLGCMDKANDWSKWHKHSISTGV